MVDPTTWNEIAWNFIEVRGRGFSAGPTPGRSEKYDIEDILAFGEFRTISEDDFPGLFNVAVLKDKLCMIPLDATGRDQFAELGAKRWGIAIPDDMPPWEGMDFTRGVASRILWPPTAEGQPLFIYRPLPDRSGCRGILDKMLKLLTSMDRGAEAELSPVLIDIINAAHTNENSVPEKQAKTCT